MDRSLAEDLAERLAGATACADTAATRVTRREWGRVERVGDGVASISGLPGARLDELLSGAGVTFDKAAAEKIREANQSA